MKPQDTCDVLIAGAGIIGATTALALADAGLAVMCTGHRATTLGTASGAAGAMLGVLGEVTADQDTEPGSLDEAELKLRQRSALAWPVLAERLTDLTDRSALIQRGTAVIAAKPADRPHLATIRAAAERLELPCQLIPTDDVPYLFPAPDHATIEALWLSQEGHVDTRVVLPALYQALARHPRVHHAPQLVRHLVYGDQHVTGAVLDDGSTVHAGHVVLAAGIATQTLLQQLGERTGVSARLLPGKGTSVTVHDPGHTLEGHVIRTPNREFACGTHLIGHAAGDLYLGATNRIADTPGADQRASGGEVANLLHSGIHEINTSLRTAAVTEIRYGMRPLSSDGYPLVGPTQLSGLHLATGTYRNGVLLAPAIAEILTAIITGQAPLVENPFAPIAAWRPRPPNIRALLQAGVPHIVAFLLEPHGRLPYNRRGELTTALDHLFEIAFTDSPATAELRARCIALLESASVTEVVPQLFYELAASR